MSLKHVNTSLPFSMRVPSQCSPFTLEILTSNFYLFILMFNVYLFLRERERERESESRGEAEREKETQNLNQIPGSALSAQSLRRGLNSGTETS